MARMNGGKATRYPGIKRLPDGRYSVRAKARDPRTGLIRQRERILDASTAIADVVRARVDLTNEIANGIDEAPRKLALRICARLWLDGKRRTIALSTAERYASALDLHILPQLGDLFVDTLTPADVLRCRDAMAASTVERRDDDGTVRRERVSARTVNGWMRVLKALLADACAELRIAASPAARIRALPEEPAHTDDDPNLLDGSELRALLDDVREHAPDWYPLILTLASTGLRPGEATALRWEDLDAARGEILVRRSNWRGRIRETTKTGVSRRVPAPPELIAALDAHRRALLASQHPGLAAGWMFPSRRTGEPVFGGSIAAPLRKALRRANVAVRLTPHGFRRTLNDLLRRVTSPIVQRSITGHSDERMSEHYSHVRSEEKSHAVTRAFELVRVAPTTEDRAASADRAGADRGADVSTG